MQHVNSLIKLHCVNSTISICLIIRDDLQHARAPEALSGLATNEVRYLSYLDALFIHLELMRLMVEPRRGVFDRSLVESALAPPKQAAAYENADLIRQASTLYYGLIKNHPWMGGNKRTATAIVNEFLKHNGFVLSASIAETLELVLAVEAGQWKVDEIENWLRQHTTQVGT